MKRTLAALAAAASILVSAPSVASATGLGRAGGPLVRTRLSTVHSGPLSLTGATTARTAEGAAVRPGSLRRLTFGHRAGAEIPAGSEIASDADNRHPDEPVERPRGRYGVLDEGIGGNRVLSDSTCFGEAATKRFARDVLSRPDVVLEWIDDVISSGFDFECFKPNPEVPAADLITGHRSLIRQAHARGVRVIGGTVPPAKGFGGYGDRVEAVRTELNTWIRTSGDHLHPNNAGYHAMAAALDLRSL